MSEPADLRDVLVDLGQCLQALGAYADDVVVTGGLAPILYRSVLPADTSARPAMTTFDIDLALPASIPFHPDGLHQQMHAGGFVHLISGEGDAPVTQYQHARHGSAHLSPIHVEFITPRIGGMRTRQGRRQSVVEVERDLHAQTDPYVGLLLFKPLRIDASTIPGLGLTASKFFQVSHPMSFIVQKSLIRDRRPTHKKENDAAHMYDVALLTFNIWEQMSAHLLHLEGAGEFSVKWFERARQTLEELFGTRQSIGVAEVAKKYEAVMGKGNSPSEDAVYRVMRRFRVATGLEIN